jgi:hypothetical protein
MMKLLLGMMQGATPTPKPPTRYRVEQALRELAQKRTAAIKARVGKVTACVDQFPGLWPPSRRSSVRTIVAHRVTAAASSAPRCSAPLASPRACSRLAHPRAPRPRCRALRGPWSHADVGEVCPTAASWTCGCTRQATVVHAHASCQSRCKGRLQRCRPLACAAARRARTPPRSYPSRLSLAPASP